MKKFVSALYVMLFSYPVIKIHGGIWGLKRYLYKTDGDNENLLAIYDRIMAKKGSWIGCNSSFKGQPCFPHGLDGAFISGGARIGKIVFFSRYNRV